MAKGAGAFLVLAAVALAIGAAAGGKRRRRPTTNGRGNSRGNGRGAVDHGLPSSGTIAGYEYDVVALNNPAPGAPVLILFHGLRGTQQGIADALLPYLTEPVYVVVPRGKNEYGTDNAAWWTERAASEDQGTLAAQMGWVAEDFTPFLDQVDAAYGRAPVVAGHSQGGMMAALLASQVPSLVVASVPASGWVPESLWNPNSAPIYATHGDSDVTVPFERTANWLDAMYSAGAPVEFTAVEAGHSLNDPDLLQTWAQHVNAVLA